jgi:hypothetical protein
MVSLGFLNELRHERSELTKQLRTPFCNRQAHEIKDCSGYEFEHGTQINEHRFENF